MADHEYRDPALSGVPDSRYDDPRRNPIAYLPVDEPEQPWDPGGTYLMPIVVRRTDHPGPVDYSNIDPGLTYSRLVPADAADAMAETEAHVRAHLSSVADQDDDPDIRAADVRIELRTQDDGTLIVGHLPGATATAPYLQPGYDPDEDRTGHTFERWVPEEER